MNKMKIKELDKLVEDYFEKGMSLDWISLQEIVDLDFRATRNANLHFYLHGKEADEDTHDVVFVDYVRSYLMQNPSTPLSKTIDTILLVIVKFWSGYGNMLLSNYRNKSKSIDISLDEVVDRVREAYKKNDELFVRCLLRELLLECLSLYHVKIEDISIHNLSDTNAKFVQIVIDNKNLFMSSLK